MSAKSHHRPFPIPRFRGPDLRGKKVILIGPADTVTDELQDIDLSDYDYVARMNRSINTPITYRGVPYAFHNLYVRNQQKNSAKSFAGRLDRDSAAACGTEVVLFTLMNWREILRLIRKLGGIWRMRLPVQVHVLTPGFIRKVTARIAPFKPTLGFISLNYLLETDLDRLDVAGFTFFTTKYIDNYNNRVEKDADAMTWALRNGKHNPEAERQAFRHLYEQARADGKNIHLCDGVKRALYQGD